MDVTARVSAAVAAIGDDWDASRHEDASLDFKQTPDSAGNTDWRAPEKFLKDIAETVVCFANAADPGVVVIGVKNRASTRQEALVGVDQRRWNLQEIVQQLHTRTSPSITVHARGWEADGKTLYVLEVPAGRSVYSTSEGVYKIRVGDQCRPLEGEQLRGLRALRQKYDWSAESSGLGVSSLSRAALEAAASRLRDSGADELAELAEEDVRAFCQATGLWAEGSVNRAGVLLYGTAEALRTFPEWGVNVQTRESPGSEPRVLVRRDESRVPLVLLLEQIITVIAALTRSHSIRVGAAQVELVDYPPDAVREILANAFAHRDWEVGGVVEVVHTPDEMTVSSPGGLLPTLRVDRLLHDASEPRNTALAVHMARLKLAEVSGLGLDRAFRELSRMGKEPPILVDGPRFRCTLPGGSGDESFVRFVHSEQFPQRLRRDVDVLMILTALRHSRSVAASDLVGRLQRSPVDVARTLELMRGEELIEPTKATARRSSPRYTLSSSTVASMRSAVTYRTQSIDSDDAKLLRHLRRHSFITNEDVRNYLDCDVMTARNRLKRLRQRGLIDFAEGSARRGSSVTYQKTARLDELSES